MTALDYLGRMAKEYQVKADEYKQIALTAARCEAHHKSLRARKVLIYRCSDECRSMAEAEARADAHPEVIDALEARLTTAAVADSHREKLRELREAVANGRTAVASERETDKMHAGGYGGGA